MFGKKHTDNYNRPLGNFFGKLFGEKEITEENMPDREVLQYLKSSYPHNHNYVLNQGKLIPGRRLAKRYNAITSNYPAEMQRLLDLSCSKGYFTLDAVESYGCKSSMGIDIIAKELEACAAVKKYLGNETSNFEEMRLHELALQIDDFGGPFDTALVINSYQYLYFGSKRLNKAYLSHNDIFRDLRKVCKGRVIFNNRYVGQLGDLFEIYSFMFRWIAGLLFTIIYFVRGFAIAAYTHALYDIWFFVFLH